MTIIHQLTVSRWPVYNRFLISLTRTCSCLFTSRHTYIRISPITVPKLAEFRRFLGSAHLRIFHFTQFRFFSSQCLYRVNVAGAGQSMHRCVAHEVYGTATAPRHRTISTCRPEKLSTTICIVFTKEWP